jgi:DNA-directed RNA polymerase specialized sigma24 family protein
MRQKSEAQQFLSQVEKLDAIIRNKLIEQQQWKDIALGITANMEGERVQSSGSQSKMADAINRCVDMEAEIDSIVDSLVEVKREVIATIEKLDSPTEYNVLHLRYIQFLTLQEIADKYGREYGWATTTHGRALAHVQAILDKR